MTPNPYPLIKKSTWMLITDTYQTSVAISLSLNRSRFISIKIFQNLVQISIFSAMSGHFKVWNQARESYDDIFLENLQSQTPIKILSSYTLRRRKFATICFKLEDPDGVKLFFLMLPNWRTSGMKITNPTE